jgi:hypothetical protein
MARANALYREVTTIRNRQQDRELSHELRAMLYGSIPIMGLSPSAYARQSTAMSEILSVNVIQSLVDAGSAKITKNKPKPFYLTKGAGYKQQKQAKARTKYVEGMFTKLDAYSHGTQAQRLGEVFGTGSTKAYRDGNKIKLEEVYPWELVIDDAEAQHRRNLRTMYQRKYVDRYVLADYARRLENTIGRPEGDTDSMSLEDRVLSMQAAGEEVRDVLLNATADLICVYEGWHLPDSDDEEEGEETGLHMISTRTFPLCIQPWTRHRFPFSHYDWEKPIQGFWGKGIAEILCGVQVEMNELLQYQSNALHLVRGWLSVHKSANFRPSHFNNDLFRIQEWSGEKEPQYVVPEKILPQELRQAFVDLYSYAHDLVGVSESASQGEKPVGVESGAAIRTVGDIQTERLSKQGRHYEEYYLDLAEQITDLSEEIAAENPSFGVTAKDKQQLIEVKWRDVRGDDFELDIFPVSAYASDPAGRRSDIQEDLQAGFIDPDTALDLMDYPDLQEYQRRKNGWRRCIEKDIGRIVDDGVYSAPEPTYRLDGSDGKGPGAREMVRDAINDYKDREVEEDRLDLLREYAQAVEDLITKANGAQPGGAVPPSPGAGPPGGGAGGPQVPGGVLAPAAPPPPAPINPV